MACALGCDGKWAIHPSQIDVINEVFTPSQQEIALAAKVIEASAQARLEGKGAIAVEGRMVDQATVLLATKLWEQAKYLQLV
jgi:malyl-CoA/(S)-citramalyl-CoA lyase